MAAIYRSADYFSAGDLGCGYESYDRDRSFYLQTYRKRLQRIEHLLAPGSRVLDVGCGYGYMLEALAERGYEPWGLDFAGPALERCAGLVGSRAVPLEQDHERLTGKDFAAVTLFDVLEHLHDPAGVLGRFHRWLRPGGVVMMTTPDCGSVLARCSGSRWVSLKVPEHLVLYSRGGLVKLCRTLFRPLAVLDATQSVSPAFLAQRLGALFGPLGAAARLLTALPWLGNKGFEVTSGSVTFIGLRRDDVPSKTAESQP